MQRLLGNCEVKNAFPFFGIASRPQLGPFEQQVLEALWSRGNATVRELLEDRNITQAYTTVMTTLDRLYKKGLLERSAEGRAFRYRPAQSEAELHQHLIAAGLKELLASAAQHEAPISFLVDAISEHDAALLEQLQQAVARKRRDLRKKESR